MWSANIESNTNKKIMSPSNNGKKAIDIVNSSLGKRYGSERRFRLYGLVAIILALGFLTILFGDIIRKGYTAFQQTYVELDVFFDPDKLRQDSLASADYQGLVKKTLRDMFPEVKGRRDKRALYSLVSSGAAFQLQKMVLENVDLIGKTVTVSVPADDDVDMLIKGRIKRNIPEEERRLKDKQIAWIDRLDEDGRIEKKFNTTFFTAGDSREPELAGIKGAALGSFFTLLVTMLLSFPIGVAAAVYLEEFAPKNRFTDLIEVNINNLAAVPSIVFGLLGLAVFLNVFGLPRSAPLVGGLVLTLMTLPTIIIASRASLKSVPPSVREAALGVGASKMQMIWHHVLPLAMPGMLTGTIIGMAQALGETAPLLMIGMVAFIVDVPAGFTDPATVLPVQIYLWYDMPEAAYVERTSAAIMVLLAFLISMNALAVVMRKKFERRW
jgi:phosphate transport system permease protein